MLPVSGHEMASERAILTLPPSCHVKYNWDGFNNLTSQHNNRTVSNIHQVNDDNAKEGYSIFNQNNNTDSDRPYLDNIDFHRHLQHGRLHSAALPAQAWPKNHWKVYSQELSN